LNEEVVAFQPSDWRQLVRGANDVGHGRERGQETGDCCE